MTSEDGEAAKYRGSNPTGPPINRQLHYKIPHPLNIGGAMSIPQQHMWFSPLPSPLVPIPIILTNNICTHLFYDK